MYSDVRLNKQHEAEISIHMVSHKRKNLINFYIFMTCSATVGLSNLSNDQLFASIAR